MNYDARMLDAKAKEALRMRVARAVVDDGMSQRKKRGRVCLHCDR